MSPEPLLLDELPTDENPFIGSDVPSDMVPCPECGNYFKQRGITRHLESAHGIENPNKRSSTAGAKKTDAKLAVQWAEFQRGAALFASFACGQCASILVEDAQHDGEAIAAFCEGRPKLKKQIQQALTGMDIMILVGALGETGRKMIAHHSIGQRIGLGDGSHAHSARGAQENMMSFLSQMPEADRNMLLNQVFSGMAAASGSGSVAATPTVTVVMDDEVPGQPPVPIPDDLTAQDKYQMAMAHTSTEDFVQVGL